MVETWLVEHTTRLQAGRVECSTQAMPLDSSASPLRVFLCHASGDKPVVRQLYTRLRADGIEAWLDEEDLLPGQDWEYEIKLAIQRSDAVLVCLSGHSTNKAGFVQKEIKIALDIADKQPEGAIFLIPVRLEECVPPERLNQRQWVDYFEARGYERLLLALKKRERDLTELPQGPVLARVPPSSRPVSPRPREGANRAPTLDRADTEAAVEILIASLLRLPLKTIREDDRLYLLPKPRNWIDRFRSEVAEHFGVILTRAEVRDARRVSDLSSLIWQRLPNL